MNRLGWRWAIVVFPLIVAWAVWASVLSLAPVPWPDDSAFYFVAKYFFHWPPRWVMIPQAPFEPTYRIFNFNTMPLYPILIGLGRFIGIDGSHLLKFWPLTAWGLTGSLFAYVMLRQGLPALGAFVVAATLAFDQELRWASVIIRPESLIGLFGMILVLGLSFGFPKKFEPKRFWDPIAALLALGAYAHFNAVHLVFPVVFALFLSPKRLFQIAAKTLLYLSPWFLAVATHPKIFVTQMKVQWGRLAAHNDWLSSSHRALESLFPGQGIPSPWPVYSNWIGLGIWALMIGAVIFGIALPVVQLALRKFKPPYLSAEQRFLLPSVGWIVGAAWLWDSKPEIWFIYYLHLAVWTFAGLALYRCWKDNTTPTLLAMSGLLVMIVFCGSLSLAVDVTQFGEMERSESWHWSTYYDFVSCIDQRLTKLDEELGHPKPFRGWFPTFPDVTVELSRRHPDWEFTRTNDFWDRATLAIQHGHEVEAVVVTETINWAERHISAPAEENPGVESIWMTWRQHFLNRLWTEPGWKPNRYICQRGRWSAFFFMPETKPGHATR